MANKQTPILIMGKGCGNKAVEHCPQTYHFELTEKEMSEALNDPASAAKRLGLETPTEIHVGARKRAAPTAPGRTTQGDAGAGDGGAPEPRPIYCCVSCLTHSWCCTIWDPPAQ